MVVNGIPRYNSVEKHSPIVARYRAMIWDVFTHQYHKIVFYKGFCGVCGNSVEPIHNGKFCPHCTSGIAWSEKSFRHKWAFRNRNKNKMINVQKVGENYDR